MASSARIDELRKKFEENPRRYFAPLANEYRKAGDIEQAVSICREHLPQQPGHMSGHIVYGQALYEARQYEEARTVFETALALDPENLIALRHLGDIALIVGDIDGARTWYGRVLEADPRNEEIQGQLKSLESLAPPTAPTPLSTPAVLPPEPTTSAGSADSGSPEPAATLPALELTLPAELDLPPRTPASSAPTVVMSAIPTPVVAPTVEIPARPPSAPIPSLSTAPTAEITLDQVPVPAVPDLEKAAEPPGHDLPVEKAPGFEPTAAVAGDDVSAPPAGGMETPPPASVAPLTATEASEAPPIDSFTLEGLEATSMAQPSAEVNVSQLAGREAEGEASHPVTPPQQQDATEPAAAESVATSETAGASSELTFLDVGGSAPPPPEPARDPVLDVEKAPASTPAYEPDAQESPAPAPQTLPEPVMAESKPFVTETMAELYEQQGHRDEALRVYRALLEQRPNDTHIRTRIEQLEGKRGPTIRDLLMRVASRRPSTPTAPAPSASEPATQSEPAAQAAPVAAPVSEPAAVSPAPAPPPVTPAPPTSRGDLLGQLFGNAAVGGDDENAAVTLSAAFSKAGGANGSGSSAQQLPGAPAHPASKDLSLDAVFGSANQSPQPASSFSFDQFFSERATAEQPISGARSAAEGEEMKDDVAKFTQWLEGLKPR